MVAAFVAGIVLVSAGAWMVAPPAGLIVTGLLLVLIAFLEARGRRRYG